MKSDEKDENDGKAGSRRQKADDAPSERRVAPADSEPDPAPCDVCGVPALVWRKCKLVCQNCGGINKTCADL